MTLADIVTFIVIVLVLGPLVWLALRWLDRKIEAMRARQMERARERWADWDGQDCGDSPATDQTWWSWMSQCQRWTAGRCWNG